jgi:hypothetical protein
LLGLCSCALSIPSIEEEAKVASREGVGYTGGASGVAADGLTKQEGVTDSEGVGHDVQEWVISARENLSKPINPPGMPDLVVYERWPVLECGRFAAVCGLVW